MCNNDAKPTMYEGRWAIASAVSLLSMVLLLDGCAVGPDFVKPEAEIQENWNEKDDSRVATQADVASQWWRAFSDPTLDQLIKLAYQQNLPLQITGLRILEARARLGIAIGQQFPQQQEVFGSATKEGVSENAPNSSFRDRNYWDYQVGFDAVWELDFWGKFRRDVQAAHASLIASEADYDDALVSLTAEVARTYTVIRTLEVRIELTRKKRRTPGGRVKDCRVSFPQWCRHGTGCGPVPHVIRKHPGFHTPAAKRTAAGAKRLEYVIGATSGRNSDSPERKERDSNGACGSGRQHAG